MSGESIGKKQFNYGLITRIRNIKFPEREVSKRTRLNTKIKLVETKSNSLETLEDFLEITSQLEKKDIMKTFEQYLSTMDEKIHIKDYVSTINNSKLDEIGKAVLIIKGLNKKLIKGSFAEIYDETKSFPEIPRIEMLNITIEYSLLNRDDFVKIYLDKSLNGLNKFGLIEVATKLGHIEGSSDNEFRQMFTIYETLSHSSLNYE